jgi:hypothetical protein
MELSEGVGDDLSSLDGHHLWAWKKASCKQANVSNGCEVKRNDLPL